MLRKVRLILLPLSWIYAIVLATRNKLYDWGWKKSYRPSVFTICVGNLSMGGTGKSPAIEYLSLNLLKEFQLASLSRGYKRITTGYREVSLISKAIDVGDEPLQFKHKFPEMIVAVDEVRARGIKKLNEKYSLDCVLLDDAFQHRKVTPNLTILLSVYADLYVNDFVLPAGNLREPKSGAKRADIILITKCPLGLSIEEQNKITAKLRLKAYQHVFFTGIDYDKKVFSSEEKIPLKNFKNFTLVTGIANPKPLVNHLNLQNKNVKHLIFKDHHNFTPKEINQLQKEPIILTTEKDYMRLKNLIPTDQLYYLPIQMKLLQGEDKFLKIVQNSIKDYYEYRRV